MTCYTVISVLFVESCLNALDCVDIMSSHAVACVSNECRRRCSKVFAAHTELHSAHWEYFTFKDAS